MNRGRGPKPIKLVHEKDITSHQNSLSFDIWSTKEAGLLEYAETIKYDCNNLMMLPRKDRKSFQKKNFTEILKQDALKLPI